MESGSIANWNINEGETFSAGDILCSIETDKATVDFEAQDDGVIAKILAEAGPAEIKVGTAILVTCEDESDVASFADFKADSSVAQAEIASLESAAVPASTPASPTPEAAAPSTKPVSAERVVASPLAHMVAKEMGYDISTIPGTGPGGRVIAADVKEFVPSARVEASTTASAIAQTMKQPLPPITGVGYTDYPLNEQARESAARLVQAKRNVPHYYLTVDISCDALLQTRAALNASLGEDEQLGVYELLLKAAAVSMKAVPTANASWMDSVVRVYDSVDLNVVVGSGEDVYTPVLRDCGSKGLRAISKELKDAMAALDQTQEGAPAPVEGVGTFTVLNLGMYGIKSCAPIIREPQSCALALGALENRVVPADDPDSEQIYKESVVFTATLSCDHRVVDGAVGAEWLAVFKSHIEDPNTLLL